MKYDNGMIVSINPELLIEGIAKAVKVEFAHNPPEGIKTNLKLSSSIMVAVAEQIEQLSHSLGASTDFSCAMGLHNIIKSEKNPDINGMVKEFMDAHKCNNPKDHYEKIKLMISQVVFKLANNEEFKRHGAH